MAPNIWAFSRASDDEEEETSEDTASEDTASEEETPTSDSSSGAENSEDTESSTSEEPSENKDNEESIIGSSAEEKADKETRSLRERIKAVQRRVFLKKGRTEVGPMVFSGLNDPFVQNISAGGLFGYHMTEGIALEFSGGVSVYQRDLGTLRNVRFAKPVCISENGGLPKGCGIALTNIPSQNFFLDGALSWAPIYGKMSLFSEAVLHFDTYFLLGAGFTGTKEGGAVNGVFGIGNRIFLGKWNSLRFEIRSRSYVDKLDVGLSKKQSDLQNQLTLNFAWTWYFPTVFEYQYR